jgi:hypothetical protein
MVLVAGISVSDSAVSSAAQRAAFRLLCTLTVRTVRFDNSKGRDGTEALKARIAELHAAGLKPDKIAQICGVNRWTVNAYLRAIRQAQAEVDEALGET